MWKEKKTVNGVSFNFVKWNNKCNKHHNQLIPVETVAVLSHQLISAAFDTEPPASKS